MMQKFTLKLSLFLLCFFKVITFLLFISSCTLDLKKKKVFSNACKYYDIESPKYKVLVEALQKLINRENPKGGNDPYSSLLFRAIHIGHKGLVCYLLKMKTSPTPLEDTKGETIGFTSTRSIESRGVLTGGDIDILKLLLAFGYKIPKGQLLMEIRESHPKLWGSYKIPVIETLTKYGAKIDGEETEISAYDFYQSILSYTSKISNIQECKKSYRCYNYYRLREALDYAKNNNLK